MVRDLVDQAWILIDEESIQGAQIQDLRLSACHSANVGGVQCVLRAHSISVILTFEWSLLPWRQSAISPLLQKYHDWQWMARSLTRESRVAFWYEKSFLMHARLANDRIE